MRPSGFRTSEDRAAYAAIYDRAVRASPTSVSEHDVPTRFGTTHVVEAGDPADPPLIALHAMSMSSAMWLPLLPVLTAGHHVLLLDAVGDLNLSVSTAPVARPADVVAWIDEVLAACDVDRATFVGASKGSWMATRYALARAERVERLALVCPVGLVSNLSRSFWTHSVPAVMVRPTPEKLGRFVDWMAMPTTLPLLEEEPWRDVKELFSCLGTFRANLREAQPAKVDISPLAASEVPKLVLVGREERLHDGPQMAARFTERWPTAGVHVVDDANHLVFIYQTEVVSALLGEFLQL